MRLVFEHPSMPAAARQTLIRPALPGTYALRLFFFQAEDGIRDPLVTGVQTCALPIYDRLRPFQGAGRSREPQGVRDRLAGEIRRARRALGLRGRGALDLRSGRDRGARTPLREDRRGLSAVRLLLRRPDLPHSLGADADPARADGGGVAAPPPLARAPAPRHPDPGLTARIPPSS